MGQLIDLRRAVPRVELEALIAASGESIAALAREEQLDLATVREQVASMAAPLALWIRGRKRSGVARVFGIAGGQGTGKTTLAKLIETLLHETGLACARLSLDDLYKEHAERERLAREVHPLLVTRGVPGTHDVALGLSVLDGLRQLGPGAELALPRFDKARDDRAAAEAWPVVRGPIEVIVFEGWCLGARAETDAELATPINRLERDHDRDARFRRYVNAELAGAYQDLFARIDDLVFFAAPSFDAVRRWRKRQEEKLRASVAAGSEVMDDARLEFFLEHYERITRRMLSEPPARAEFVLRLDEDQHCRAVEAGPDALLCVPARSPV